jgi:hypothetical protein
MTPAIYTHYTEIVLRAITDAKLKINKCKRNFMLEIFMLYLSIPNRINFQQSGRYATYLNNLKLVRKYSILYELIRQKRLPATYFKICK